MIFRIHPIPTETGEGIPVSSWSDGNGDRQLGSLHQAQTKRRKANEGTLVMRRLSTESAAKYYDTAKVHTLGVSVLYIMFMARIN